MPTLRPRLYNRTESFTIAIDPLSHLNVDVYRAELSTSNKQTVDVYNIFTNDNFSTYYDEVSGRVIKSLQSMKVNGPRWASSSAPAAALPAIHGRTSA